MKRLLVILVALLVFALIITSCTTSTPTTSAPATTAPATTPVGVQPTTSAPATTTSAQPTGPTKDKIVIGMSRPLSGPEQAVGDSAFKPIYETMIPMWNEEGGIYVAEYGKKLPIELKIYDSKSDIKTLTQQIEQLIVQDKVDFLMGPQSTAGIFAAAPIANKYQKILLTMEGGATSLKDMLPSLPYVFVPLSFSDWYEVPVLADIFAANGVKTAYVVYIADLHGIEYSGVTGIEFPKKGIDVVASKSLPPEMTDFSLIIKEAQASNADALLVYSYPQHVLPITGQMIELGYNPKAYLTGPGANFGFFHDSFGPAVEGVMCWATWNRKMSPEMAAMADKLYAGKPEAAHDWWGHSLYWAAMEFWKQAVEKAGTLDNAKVQQVMATEHFQTILGDTYFTNGLMAKESHPGEVGQWQNGIVEIVGGNKVTAPLIYPKPAWPSQ
ncbi:MAG: amino acid ABC transporter substrate-binding protein [Dehalococcoidales bacterium]|nr:amino acid ABC transporter substrate-binding protein [Dehalococcoidales bacterium]